MGEPLEAGRIDARDLREDSADTQDDVGRALVIGVVSRDRVRVRTASGHVRVATLAAAGYTEPSEGDGVVVMTGARETFVVGVLGRARLRSPLVGHPPGHPPEEPTSLPDATQSHGALVRDADGVVRLGGGDVRLEVTEGALDLVARDGVRLRTEARVDIAAETIEAHARFAELHIDESKLVGRAVTTAVETVVVVAERVETEAVHIVERAKAAYREIEDIAQTRAGRFRAIARGTLSLFGKSASLVAEEDAKIDGEKVLLG